MKLKEMDLITAHFDKYFEQESNTVIHPTVDMNPHIDALLYEPTEKYPFWKLATMGASDYKMKAPKNALGDRNEYIMAISPDEDMNDKSVVDYYYSMLLEVAMYPVSTDTFISYGHSMEWPIEEDEEMVGAFIEFPQMIEDPDILRCKLGLFKTAICLMVVLINNDEMEMLLKDGPENFSNYLFPEDEEECHFFSERTRTENF